MTHDRHSNHVQDTHISIYLNPHTNNWKIVCQYFVSIYTYSKEILCLWPVEHLQNFFFQARKKNCWGFELNNLFYGRQSTTRKMQLLILQSKGELFFLFNPFCFSYEATIRSTLPFKWQIRVYSSYVNIIIPLSQ